MSITARWVKQPEAGDGWGEHGYVEVSSDEHSDDPGRHVVEADEPTKLHITKAGGGEIWSETTRSLLLPDGRVLYGCVDCDYVSANSRSVPPHRNMHRNVALGGKKLDLSVPLPADGEMLAAFQLLLHKAAAYDQVVVERDDYRKKWMDLDKSFATLRNAFGRVMDS